jgi:serine/threonine protein kinase
MSEPQSRPSREERLGAVLVDCLEALDQGQVPDRQELLARYPELAPELIEFLNDHADVDRLTAPLRGMSKGGASAPPEKSGLPGRESESMRLGDYRIVREVGRGGMGIVYEAEQVSLGRRVALKVLPFAATLDPRQLQRFHNEARAAAGLHHTNIVPVFGVGCESGVHYYAMQFIDGRTLAEFIAEQRGAAPGADAAVPTVPAAAQETSVAPRDATYFRRVAEWGIQAAEALDCAHSLGVVHRDVKPANLLVDTAGRLWVTDFGLAQVQSDARLTATGDLVGTLRYMSPEQALAQRAVIDHRTDVYSLGATLYELLTLEPAFGGTDRQELLRQVAFEEPRSPRRVDRTIPAELGTLVLKAMEKNPPDRYATARDFADDLRRFLLHEPIRAKRPNLLQWGRKWAQRHRSAVASAVVVLVLALVGLAIGTYLLWQQEAATRAALKQVEEQRGAALTNEEKANALRRQAEVDLDKTLNAMLDLPQVLHKKEFTKMPGIGRVRQALAAQMLRHYQSYLDEQNPDPAVRYRTARTYQAVGNLYSLLGEHHKARETLVKSVTLSEARTREFPAEPRNWLRLGHYHSNLAEILAAQGLKPQATDEYRKSVDAFEKAARLAPDNTSALNNLAWTLVTSNVPTIRDPARAVVLARRAVQLDPYRSGAWDTLGVACYRTGNWAEAVAALERRLAMLHEWTTSDADIAVSWFYLAMAYSRLGRDQKARPWYDKAVHWSDSNEPQHEGLRRIRAEATEVLGIKDRPGTDDS